MFFAPFGRIDKEELMILKNIARLGFAASLMTTTAFAETEIVWWHAMGGQLGESVNEIAASFNASQS